MGESDNEEKKANRTATAEAKLAAKQPETDLENRKGDYYPFVKDVSRFQDIVLSRI